MVVSQAPPLLLYCVNVNRTSLDHLLLGKSADVDQMSNSRSILRDRRDVRMSAPLRTFTVVLEPSVKTWERMVFVSDSLKLLRRTCTNGQVARPEPGICFRAEPEGAACEPGHPKTNMDALREDLSGS